MLVGPWNFPVPSAQTPPKTSISRFSRNTRVKPPNVVSVRKLRNANAVPMSPNGQVPSYGQNGFLFIGTLPDKTDDRQNGPQFPPKRPYPGPQGHLGPQAVFPGSALSMQSNLVSGRFAQNGHPPGRSIFGCFWPVSGPERREISLSPPDTQKPTNHELPGKHYPTLSL